MKSSVIYPLLCGAAHPTDRFLTVINSFVLTSPSMRRSFLPIYGDKVLVRLFWRGGAGGGEVFFFVSVYFIDEPNRPFQSLTKYAREKWQKDHYLSKLALFKYLLGDDFVTLLSPGQTYAHQFKHTYICEKNHIRVNVWTHMDDNTFFFRRVNLFRIYFELCGTNVSSLRRW